MALKDGANEKRVLIAPEISTSGDHLGKFLSLRHPKSGNPTCYLLSNGLLQELQWLKQSYGSWFLGEYVCEDGRLYTATPVDPVFILLPIFDAARLKKQDDLGKFRQLEEILYVDSYPEYRSLLSIADRSMEVVCDVKESGSIKFFRLNDAKVLRWLCYKVQRVRQILPSLDKNYAARKEKDSLVDAVSVVGEYIKEEPWLHLLCDELKLDLQAVNGSVDNSTTLITENSPALFKPEEEKNGNDKKTPKTGRQTKKPKMETDSRNIRDMFTRASRRK
ncbi:endoribonuclease [Lithospermum erythrorhizon]|uniref:Ribonuclease H2 subunit B n=1 Tax=Lithospermum erythrorhizon TaxID=34254 RepID=A0AAV3QDB6_LITER